MKLEYNGVRIEIGDAASSPQYFDKLHSLWTEQDIDFGTSERMTVYGVTVNVMPVHQLLTYKAAHGLASVLDIHKSV